MCNSLHHDSKPIPESGVAWKLFSRDNTIWVHPGTHYIVNHDGWIRWDDGMFLDGNGFCFFMEKSNFVIESPYSFYKKIEYRKGLGRHYEYNFLMRPVEIALCKEFRII